MPFSLSPLPYSFDALEPHIDARTMEIHYAKHHQAYCDKLNAAIVGTKWEEMPIEDILRNLDDVPEDKRTAVRNHGGGFHNHTLFWQMMTPEQTEPSAEVAGALTEAFGSVQDFKTQFSEKATLQFGSGWAWLVRDNGKLKVLGLPNQDSPLSLGMAPILGLDVWEHAYYLYYQNRRPEYIAAWWSVVDWDEVGRRLSGPV